MDGATAPKHELIGFTGVTPFQHKRYLLIPVSLYIYIYIYIYISYIFIKGIYPCNNKFTSKSEMNATSRGSVRIHRTRMTEGRLEYVYVPDVRIHHLQFTSTYQPSQMYR